MSTERERRGYLRIPPSGVAARRGAAFGGRRERVGRHCSSVPDSDQTSLKSKVTDVGRLGQSRRLCIANAWWLAMHHDSLEVAWQTDARYSGRGLAGRSKGTWAAGERGSVPCIFTWFWRG
eukprot:2310640-Rhodomonas_salina.3